MRNRQTGWVVLMLLAVWGCSPQVQTTGGKWVPSQLRDGVFDGHYKGGAVTADVRVTIKAQRVAKIEMLQHDCWKGKKAVPAIPNRIIENQSTVVESISGATVSSKVIMNAVQDALKKARPNGGGNGNPGFGGRPAPNNDLSKAIE